MKTFSNIARNLIHQPFIIFTLNPYLTWSKPIKASWCQSSMFISYSISDLIQTHNSSFISHPIRILSIKSFCPRAYVSLLYSFLLQYSPNLPFYFTDVIDLLATLLSCPHTPFLSSCSSRCMINEASPRHQTDDVTPTPLPPKIELRHTQTSGFWSKIATSRNFS
jgi:hypothetical protein